MSDFLGKSPDFWRRMQGMGEGFAGRGPQWQAAQARQREAEALSARVAQQDAEKQAELMREQARKQFGVGIYQAGQLYRNGDVDGARTAIGRLARPLSQIGVESEMEQLNSLINADDSGFGRGLQMMEGMAQASGILPKGTESKYESIVTGQDGNRYGLMNGRYQQIPSPEGVQFSGGGVTVNTGDRLSPFARAVESTMADSYTGIISQANDARSQINLLDPLLKMDVATGFGEQAKGTAARIAGMIAGPEAASRIANLPAQEAFTSLSETLVNETLNQAKGPQTDQDAIRVRSTMASLGKTPEANKFILGYAYGIQRRKIDRALFFKERVQKDGGNFAEVESQWNQFIESTPLVSERVKMKGIPQTFYQFEQQIKADNPSVSRDVILNKWREING